MVPGGNHDGGLVICIRSPMSMRVAASIDVEAFCNITETVGKRELSQVPRCMRHPACNEVCASSCRCSVSDSEYLPTPFGGSCVDKAPLSSSERPDEPPSLTIVTSLRM